MNKVIDRRVDGGMTLDEYTSFFEQTTCGVKLKTKVGGVNNRGNKLGDEVSHTSITDKFEQYGDAVNGYNKESGSRTPDPSQADIRNSRINRSNNAEKRS